jgi:hypothetical protein
MSKQSGEESDGRSQFTHEPPPKQNLCEMFQVRSAPSSLRRMEGCRAGNTDGIRAAALLAAFALIHSRPIPGSCCASPCRLPSTIPTSMQCSGPPCAGVAAMHTGLTPPPGRLETPGELGAEAAETPQAAPPLRRLLPLLPLPRYKWCSVWAGSCAPYLEAMAKGP